MSNARTVLVTLCCFTLFLACGDDSSKSANDDAPDIDAAIGSSSPDPTPDAGSASTGADQGESCREDDDCKGSLTCVSGPPGSLSHCGRGCTDDSDCVEDLDEQCITYTGSASDLHCTGITDVPFSACSIEDNVACAEPMTCLPPGVCLEICEFDTDSDTDAGMDADAGTDGNAGVGRGSCSRESDECVEGILTTDEVGACALFIDRGEVCGGENGMCAIEDLCAPDPLLPFAQDRCVQRCGEAGDVCDDDTECTVIGMFIDGSDASVCQ